MGEIHIRAVNVTIEINQFSLVVVNLSRASVTECGHVFNYTVIVITGVVVVKVTI